MKFYPISTPRDPYRGNNEARRRKKHEFDAASRLIEDHLNAEMTREPMDAVRTFLTAEIARRFGLDQDLTHRIVFPIDGGHNGVTICKGNLDRAFTKPAEGQTP